MRPQQWVDRTESEHSLAAYSPGMPTNAAVVEKLKETLAKVENKRI